jgi:hypothetical protein
MVVVFEIINRKCKRGKELQRARRVGEDKAPEM